MQNLKKNLSSKPELSSGKKSKAEIRIAFRKKQKMETDGSKKI